VTVLPAVLLAQVALTASAAAPDGRELIAFASASPRPVECAAVSVRGARRAVWERARQPRLALYCDALANGYSALGRAPADALTAARKAQTTLPGRAAAIVLEARALVALGKSSEAWPRFVLARKSSRRSVESPGALHDFAVAALESGHHEEAVRAFRALAPRAGLLGDGYERQRVYVEAAAMVMTLGPEALNEASGYLAEARRKGTRPGFGDWVLGLFALVLDRQGRSEEASGVLAEAGGAWFLARMTAERGAGRPLVARALPVLAGGEEHAIVAMLAQDDAPELARERWQTFLDGPGGKGPWAEHARQKLRALEARRKKGR
jgi:hypothetical protein